MADLLHRLIGEHVRLDIRLTPIPAWVRVDPGQLEQILMNLLLNARDALPGGGEIQVVTSHAEAGPGQAPADDLPSGAYVTIEVRDTGAGMTPDVIARVFEPFFTTKDVGKGIGLSTVYGIVKQSGGTVRVASAPAVGSTFTVYLPLVDAAEDRDADAEADPHAHRTLARVLLVEDEEIVRDFLREILEVAGCTVVSAANGREAIRIAEADPGAIDIVVTDLVMPGMGGAELMARLSVRRPGLPVVYMSGYADHEAPDLDRPGAVFLRKPLSPSALARAVQDALREHC
jgi:CheY-like chemotaxis protein